MFKELRIYRSSKGKEPFKAWFCKVKDKVAQQLIHTRLDRLAVGHEGDCKQVGNGVYELRIHYGSGYRLYFAKQGQTIILLLLGGNKHTQTHDIDKAKQYWADFQERLNNETN